MTIDVDTLETQVSEQLADLVQSLGNLKEQAENHGSSSKTLSETAAEVKQLIPAITATTAAIESSAEAVRKVDTAAVLQELQETRTNLETALTTAAQKNDTFQSKQEATGDKVSTSMETLLEDARHTKNGVTMASESIEQLEKSTAIANRELSDSLQSLEKSALANAASTVERLSARTDELHAATNKSVTEAASSLMSGQSTLATSITSASEQILGDLQSGLGRLSSSQNQQLTAIDSAAVKTERVVKQFEDRFEQADTRRSAQVNTLEQAIDRIEKRLSTELAATEERHMERMDELETRATGTRTLVLAFGAVSVVGILAILGALLFGG